MKSSAVIALTLVASAAAFVPQTSFPSTRTTLAMSDPEDEDLPKNPVYKQPKRSGSTPFMARSSVLDGTLAGDVGFDPLGFSKDKAVLMQYREAEIKHARLAMLAAAGWPVSELLNRKLAVAFNAPAIIDETRRAPSIPNGGLGKISPVFWVACLLAASLIELYGLSKTKGADYFPGNLGFDPLGLYPKDPAGQRRMQLAEIRNGRLAMIAITSFAFQEYVTKLGVVEETPFFFKPLGGAIQAFVSHVDISP